MGILSTVLVSLLAIFMLWMLFRTIKQNPEMFSAKALNKSAFTMGLLALGLIALIAFVVMLLKV